MTNKDAKILLIDEYTSNCSDEFINRFQIIIDNMGNNKKDINLNTLFQTYPIQRRKDENFGEYVDRVKKNGYRVQ